MFWRRFLAAALAVGSLCAAGAGARAECGLTYEVERGDTLNRISRKFYGEDDPGAIHDANRDVIGPDASLIEIGVPLWIPCRGGETAMVVAAPPAEAEEEAAAPAAAIGPLRVLAGAARAPLSGGGLPEGGMLEEMLAGAAAKARLEVAPPVRVPAPGAALGAVLAAGGFDVGFPWTRSGCEGGTDCADLIFSDPFFDVEMGVYARRDGRIARAKGFADLAGARLCRPVGLAMDDLEPALAAAPVELLRLDAAEACLAELRAGRVDAVSVDAELAALLLERDGGAGEIARLPFSTRQMLHAAVARGHPRAREIVAAINAGLADLRRSGAWFAIAHRHLARAQEVAGRAQPRG